MTSIRATCFSIRLWAGLALCWLCCCCNLAAWGQTVVLTGNEARAPKISKDLQGNAEGVLIEVMKYVSETTGLHFTYTLYPWARAYNAAVDGEMGIIGLSRTKEREALFDFSSEPLFFDDVVLVVRAGKEFPFNTPADLKGRKVGVCNNCSYGDAYNQAVREQWLRPEPGNRISAQLRMLLTGRLDAVLVPVGRAGLSEALRDTAGQGDLRAERDKFTVLPKPFARDPNYVAFAKSMNQHELLARIDKALKAGNANGTLPKRIDAYIAEHR